MKKYFTILTLVLLFAFLFVSCEDFDLDALGGIIGDLTGEMFTDDEAEPYDYSDGGHGTNATLAGTWTAHTTEFGEGFSLLDCTLTVTLTEGGDITIVEEDASGNKQFNETGSFILDDDLNMIVMTKDDPQADEELSSPWLAIKRIDDKYSVINATDKEDIFNSDYDALYHDYEVEDTLNLHNQENNGYGDEYDRLFEGILNLSCTEFYYDKTTSELAADDETYIRQQRRYVHAVVDESYTEDLPEGVLRLIKYHEESCAIDMLSSWYRFDAEADTLTLFWRGEAVTLTR